jgi:hypothetical protein
MSNTLPGPDERSQPRDPLVRTTTGDCQPLLLRRVSRTDIGNDNAWSRTGQVVRGYRGGAGLRPPARTISAWTGFERYVSCANRTSCLWPTRSESLEAISIDFTIRFNGGRGRGCPGGLGSFGCQMVAGGNCTRYDLIHFSTRPFSVPTNPVSYHRN